ncbi:KAP family P-loop NTPase fold protein [Sphingobium phenoxybenzoativorans]|uniref:KAP family P-loop NTPase fold protein n=1 Tax=Sphingobium phenoxybenzoativorans TaxID=1592790 RepID=UPI000872CA50|nr:P-loop NTPase fold protein [Sphingobium phenoxybenzoativorans]
MKILKRIFTTAGVSADQLAPEHGHLTEKPESNLAIQVDRPIKSVAEDIFDRASFAKQIAKTISHRRDPSSLIIGIYAPWGDGKTSTLAMVEEYLKPAPDILTMYYNPWFYGDSTEAITRSFFYSIKNKLEKSGWFSKQNIGDLMAAYGKAIPKVGDVVHSVGEAITTEALVETRDKVGGLLRKHGKKVVVFIDDIDRLDRRDIQTLFKLVRLSGDFDHTTYLLAFDDAIVSEALGEAYGKGDPLAGRRFLEKIVQVPLHLPPARSDKLRDLMFAACDRVISENNIELGEADGPELGHALMEAFGYTLKTPRRVKLFDNAISFAVPVLKGEVRVVDQILIEGLRIFYPTIYEAVRANSENVLKGRDRRQEYRQPPSSPIDRAFEQLKADDVEKDAIRDLLVQLFPRLSQTEYGDDWDSNWAIEKRICSSDYFRRYFTYAVPTGDMPDQEIDTILARAQADDGDGVGALFDDAFERNAAELLIRKLRRHEETLDLTAVPTLSLALAKRASKIPISGDFLFGTFAISQAAILICQLMQRMEAARQDAILMSAAENTDSLFFISQLLRWARIRETEGQERGFLTPERIHPITAVLARRLFANADESNIVDCAGDHFGELVFSIFRNCDEIVKHSLLDRLSAFLDATPQNALLLLRGLCGRSKIGNGIVRPSEFTTETYESLSALLDLDRVYSQLRAIYGIELDTATWENNWNDNYDVDRRIADQFSVIHRRQAPKAKSAMQPEN